MSCIASLNHSYKCRGCMKNKTTTTNLFETTKFNYHKISTISFADMFGVCTAIPVMKDDGLPQQLCNLCIESLTIAYDFRIQCEESNISIRRLLALEEKNRTNNHPDIITIKEELTFHNFLKTDMESDKESEIECEPDFHVDENKKRNMHNLIMPIFFCKICKATFKIRNDLIRHESQHSQDELLESNVKPHTCDVCGRSFKRRGTMMEHRRTHTSETPYLCYLCGKCFKTNAYLRQHRTKHSVTKPFKCHLCPEKFKCKGSLNSHIKSHGSHTKDYVCDICGSSFYRPSGLRKHKDSHSGLKPWKCDSCSKTFTHKNKLKRHMIIHTGNKPFKCSYCDKAYNQHYNLTVHLRSHVGENQFQCTVCNEKFRLKSDLKKHYPIHYINESLMVNNEITDTINSEMSF